MLLQLSLSLLLRLQHLSSRFPLDNLQKVNLGLLQDLVQDLPRKLKRRRICQKIRIRVADLLLRSQHAQISLDQAPCLTKGVLLLLTDHQDLILLEAQDRIEARIRAEAQNPVEAQTLLGPRDFP